MAEGIDVLPGLAARDGSIPTLEHTLEVGRVMGLLPAFLLQLSQSEAGVLRPAAIEPKTLALAVSHPGHLRDVFGHGAKTFLALAQGGLGVFAGRNVVIGLEDRGRTALGVAIQRPAGVDDDARSGASSLDQFPIPTVVPFENGQDFSARLQIQRLEQLVLDAPDGLLRAPAIKGFGAMRPITDAVIEVADDNGIVAEVKQPGQLGQVLLAQFVIGDVARNLDETNGLALGVAQWPHDTAGEEPLSIFANVPALVRR